MYSPVTFVARGEITGLFSCLHAAYLWPRTRPPVCKQAQVLPSWSTKTCSVCGHLNDVGASREYHCVHCGLTADRDALAAKNTLVYNSAPCIFIYTTTTSTPTRKGHAHTHSTDNQKSSQPTRLFSTRSARSQFKDIWWYVLGLFDVKGFALTPPQYDGYLEQQLNHHNTSGATRMPH